MNTEPSSLEQWIAANPPDQPKGVRAHLAAILELEQRGYRHAQIREWLATKGVRVTRQAVSKALSDAKATAKQPNANESQPAATAEQPKCKTEATRSPSGEPQQTRAAEPATLKARAQAVGDKYLNQTNPLAARLLNKQPPK